MLAGQGSDLINVTGTGNTTSAIRVEGGDHNNGDLLTITNVTAGTTSVIPGATPDSRTVTSPNGTIQFDTMEFLQLNAAGGNNFLNVQGTNDNDTFAIQNISGNSVWLNDRAVVNFTNYQTVNLFLFGDDIQRCPQRFGGVTASTCSAAMRPPTTRSSSAEPPPEYRDLAPTAVDAATITGLGRRSASRLPNTSLR